MSFLGAALVGLGANFISNLFNKKNVESTNKTNTENINATNQANIDLYNQQWKDKTAYEDPSNVVKRLLNAGLNPNLALTSGLQSAPNSNIPSLMAAQNQAFQYQPVDPLTMAQISNINADTELKQQEVKESASRVSVNSNSIQLGDRTFLLNKSLTESQIRSIDENIKLIQPQIDQLHVSVDKVRSEIQSLSYDDQLKQLEIIFKKNSDKLKLDELSNNVKISSRQAAMLALDYIKHQEFLDAKLKLLQAQANDAELSFKNNDALSDLYVESEKSYLSHMLNTWNIENAFDNDVTGISSYVLAWLNRFFNALPLKFTSSISHK